MIRDFEPRDLPAVMRLWLNGNLDAHPFLPAVYWEAHFAAVEALIPQADVLVYEEKGTIVGFLGRTDDYIAGIFVDRLHRSKGIGAQLLTAAQAQRSRLTLSVYEKNPAAVRFYERTGFHTVERRLDAETGEPEYCMAWQAQRSGQPLHGKADCISSESVL